MVANNLEGRSPVWQGVRSLPTTRPTNVTGPDAPSSGITIRTVPKVGIEFRRTIQPANDVNRKQIHYRRHRLLHKVGGSKSTTRQYRGIGNVVFIRIYMVSIGLSNQTHKRPKRTLPQPCRGGSQSILCNVHKRSTPYYPQANGLAKSTNKTLQHILRKIVNENQTDWDMKLHSALWAYVKSSVRKKV